MENQKPNLREPVGSQPTPHRRSLWLRLRQKCRGYFSFGAVGLLVLFIAVPLVFALVTPNEKEKLWIERGASEQRLGDIEEDAAQERENSAQRLSDLGKDWDGERATLDNILAEIASFQ